MGPPQRGPRRPPWLKTVLRFIDALREPSPSAEPAPVTPQPLKPAPKATCAAAAVPRKPIDFYELNTAETQVGYVSIAIKKEALKRARAAASKRASTRCAEGADSADRAAAAVDAGAPIGYRLKRSGARRSIGLSVRAGALLVSAPKWATSAQIDAALREHAGWICRKLEEARHAQSLLGAALAEPCWCDGARVAYHGRLLQLRLDPAAGAPGSARLGDDGAAPGRDGVGSLYIALPTDARAAAVRAAAHRFLRAQAETRCIERLDHFAARMDLRWHKLALSNAATRWGSASANGSIRLHWRLIQLAPELLDYVVVHELAHLRQMNHSPLFWAVVGDVLPEYAVLRKQLKALHLPPWE